MHSPSLNESWLKKLCNNLGDAALRLRLVSSERTFVSSRIAAGSQVIAADRAH